MVIRVHRVELVLARAGDVPHPHGAHPVLLLEAGVEVLGGAGEDRRPGLREVLLDLVDLWKVFRIKVLRFVDYNGGHTIAPHLTGVS